MYITLNKREVTLTERLRCDNIMDILYLSQHQTKGGNRALDWRHTCTCDCMNVRWSLVYCPGREIVACIALKCCLLIFAHHLLLILLPAIRGVGFTLFMLKWVLFVSCDLILKWSGSVGVKTVYSSAYLLSFLAPYLPGYTRLPTYLLYYYIYLLTRLPASLRSFLYIYPPIVYLATYFHS